MTMRHLPTVKTIVVVFFALILFLRCSNSVENKHKEADKQKTNDSITKNVQRPSPKDTSALNLQAELFYAKNEYKEASEIYGVKPK